MLCSKITPPGCNDSDAIELKNNITMLFQTNKINLVQIGANDGISADPIFDYIIENDHINAFLVEPQHGAFEELKKNYKNIRYRAQCYKYAITDSNNKIKLYKNNAINGTDGHSSLIIRDIDIHNNIVVADFNEDSYELVDGITVHSFMNLIQNVHIDIMIIDTEGYDLEIIKMFFKDNIFPKLIYFESPGIQGYIPEKDFLKGNDANDFIDTILKIKYNVTILQSNWLCILHD